MLKDNLMILRNIKGYSQEELAARIGVSRQAYAKWEAGSTLPGIDKCMLLADIYDVSLDSLVNGQKQEDINCVLPPAPKGKNLWGSVTINERGQIVIPKAARDKFGLTGGQRLIVATDEVGIALLPAEAFEARMRELMAAANRPNEE